MSPLKLFSKDGISKGLGKYPKGSNLKLLGSSKTDPKKDFNCCCDDCENRACKWRVIEVGYSVVYYSGDIDDEGILLGLPSCLTIAAWAYNGYLELQVTCRCKNDQELLVCDFSRCNYYTIDSWVINSYYPDNKHCFNPEYNNPCCKNSTVQNPLKVIS